MIRKISKVFFPTNMLGNKCITNQYSFCRKQISTRGFLMAKPLLFRFSDLPRHNFLTMPALSPTMSEGKIVKWLKKVGDKVDEGEVICQIETDKATVGFEVQQKGYIAQIKESDNNLPVGSPVAVLVKKAEYVSSFSDYSFFDALQHSKSAHTPQQQSKPKASQDKSQKKVPEKATKKKASNSKYPAHDPLKMPALSPTMTEGKIVKWILKQGDSFQEGDALCEIQTDKATVPFQASSKGILAKIVAGQSSSLKVGDTLGVSVKNKKDVGEFKNYTLSEQASSNVSEPAQQIQSQEKKSVSQSPKPQKKQSRQQASNGAHIFASPASRTLAAQRGIDLAKIGKGSGPNGRIIRQDVQLFVQDVPAKETKKASEQKTAPQQTSPKQPSKKPAATDFPQNPYEQLPLSGMRKVIASRLTQSKTTIPHYYISLSIEMDKVNKLRTEFNANQQQNGVKISVNDIIVKAMALALRDYPTVNSQWHGNHVKRFKYSDISVAVATEGGLITPIVYRADTLGLKEISKRTKDVAKRARQGKLDPREYAGGTCTISNLGMYGIDSVISVINPPQSTILGIGKTEKKILFDEKSTDPQKPYRVAEVMQVVVSADHRVVDGAMAAQWLTRVKKYLEHPTQMLL